MGFTVQINGKTYTADELKENPSILENNATTDKNVNVTNVCHGDMNGIQVGTFDGTVHFNR